MFTIFYDIRLYEGVALERSSYPENSFFYTGSYVPICLVSLCYIPNYEITRNK